MRVVSAFSLLLFLNTSICFALSDGAADGTFSIDNVPKQMKFAVATESEGLFDPSKKDLIITISDKSIGDTLPDDKVDLSLKARKGDLTAISVRLSGTSIANVSIFYKELSGTIMVPGNWFSYIPKGTRGGTLELTTKEFDGHKYSANLQYQASEYKPSHKKTMEEDLAMPTYPPTPTLPQASTSFIQKDSHTALLIAAIMQKDEDQAVKIINIGIDPNSKDQYGIPILNWAVMTCLPKVVQAIVNKKPDLNYERAPGMTILTEAGACPEAHKILKEAGAQ